VVLLGDRFLHLEHEVDVPHVVGVGEDRRPGGNEVVVRQRGADSGVLLDVHLVPGAGQLVHPGWRDRHPVLVVLDLPRDPDLHDPSPPRRWTDAAPLPRLATTAAV
jgi:hypothetical protein